MARVIGSSVPSDLLTFYREILNRPLAINADRAITVSVLGYQPPAPPDSILRLRREQATGTAEWLANHNPNAQASNRYNKLLTAFCTRFDYDISGYFAIPDLRLIAGKSRPEYNRLRYKSAAAPGYNRLITWRKWGQYLPAKLAQTLDPFDSKEIQLIFSPI